jgi:hypothetical protein
VSTLPTRHTKGAGETRNIAVDFRGKLRGSEKLTGTPTIVEVTTSALTLTNKAVNTAAVTILGESVGIGLALQVRVSGGTAGAEYEIKFTCATDSDPAQTVEDKIELGVI